MSVRQNLPWSRPDGGQWTSRRTTVRQDFFENSAEKSFLYKNIDRRDGSIVRTDARPLQVISIIGFTRPNHGEGVSGRLKLQHAISISDTRASRPWGGDVRTVEVESSVTIYDALASGPQLSDVRTVKFKLRFLPYGHMRPDGWLIFPFLNLERISEPFENW